MVKRKHKLLSMLICLLMVMSVMAVMTVSTATAAVGDRVFCENDAGWSEVYCYMWKDNSGDNGGWPGQKMTKGDDGLWYYDITGEWDEIIFNNNSGTQTDDMVYQGHGSCYNNKTKSWSQVDVEENTTPSVPETTTPSVSPSEPTGTNVVFCKNDAGWSSVNVYMWTDGAGDNKSWPGVAATNIGEDIWMLEYEGDYKMIIFNNGSGTQTSNLNHPGSGQMYNNKTGEWSLYDTSQLHIKSTTADPATPQYTGVEISLSMTAGGGEGELSYKFTATSGSSTTVISDYSSDNAVVWTPTVAGTYTITYSVKDEAGEVKTQTATYKINDITAEVKPVVQSVSVTPTNSESNEILKGKEALVDITAGGGNTGTKLLFYKVTITDPNGKTANVPYYTLQSQYKFTPTTLGVYDIEVSVQASNNATVTRSYKYECVAELSAPGALKASVSTTGKQAVGSNVTVSASASGGVAPYTYQFEVNGQVVKNYSTSASYALTLSAEGTYVVKVSVKDAEGTVAAKSVTISVTGTDVSGPGTEEPDVEPGEFLKGDSDCDGKVNIKDATAIQKHLADIIALTSQGLVNAEVDGSGNLTVKDATMIQKYLAGIDVNW